MAPRRLSPAIVARVATSLGLRWVCDAKAAFGLIQPRSHSAPISHTL